ncbi:anti-sigma factor antagonist, partial [Actinomadura sp. DSM 109109]|nr:anti-sigma factor antagonist [Actinomadura lepetitiana]
MSRRSRRRWNFDHEDWGRQMGGGDALEGLQHAPVEGVEDVGDAVVVRLAGELDLYNANTVREELVSQTDRKPRRLVVDLGRVTFIDSTGLGVLIEGRSRLEHKAAFLLAAS